MAYIEELTSLLEASSYAPLLEEDPAYIALKANIPNFISMSAKAEGYTVGSLPEELEYFIILRTLKHLFRVLSVSKAPEYNVESEQAKSDIGNRFNHYVALMSDIQKEMDVLERRGKLDAVKSYKVTKNNYSPDAFKL